MCYGSIKSLELILQNKATILLKTELMMGEKKFLSSFI